MKCALAILLAALSVGATYRDDAGTIEAYTTLNRERAASLGIPRPRHTYGLDRSQEILREVLDFAFGLTASREATVMAVESKVSILTVADSTRLLRPPSEYTDGAGYSYMVVWPSAVPDTFTVTAKDTTLTLKEVE
jgi:hypothetical protein